MGREMGWKPLSQGQGAGGGGEGVERVGGGTRARMAQVECEMPSGSQSAESWTWRLAFRKGLNWTCTFGSDLQVGFEPMHLDEIMKEQRRGEEEPVRSEGTGRAWRPGSHTGKVLLRGDTSRSQKVFPPLP